MAGAACKLLLDEAVLGTWGKLTQTDDAVAKAVESEEDLIFGELAQACAKLNRRLERKVFGTRPGPGG